MLPFGLLQETTPKVETARRLRRMRIFMMTGNRE
jgi:hypothetical protein